MTDTLESPTVPLYRPRMKRGDIVRRIRDGITATVVATSGRYVGVRFDNGATLADNQSNWERVAVDTYAVAR